MGTTNPDGTIALVPAPRSEFEPTEDASLARVQQGKLYRKQLLKKGTYPHPADPSKPLVIDDALYDKLITNFNAEVCDIVQVPVADEANKHHEDPLRNLGEVIKVAKEDGELYGYIDARDEDQARKLGKTLLGTSAMMHLDYMDTRTGQRVGPTLLHALVTNRPYITGMAGYEEVVAASADTEGSEAVVFGTREEDTVTLTKEELIAQLRDEHDIDIEKLQTELTSVQEHAAELEQRPDPNDIARQVMEVVKASGAPVNTPENQEVEINDVAEAVIELANDFREAQTELTEVRKEREAARLSAAESKVAGLVKEGRILPSQTEGFVKLAQDDPETFQKLVPASPIVDLSERGHDDPEIPDIEKFNEEVTRLTGMVSEVAGTPKK